MHDDDDQILIRHSALVDMAADNASLAAYLVRARDALDRCEDADAAKSVLSSVGRMRLLFLFL